MGWSLCSAWRPRAAQGLYDLGSVCDGIALAFGVADHVTEAVSAGAAGIALWMAARWLAEDGDHPMG